MIAPIKAQYGGPHSPKLRWLEQNHWSHSEDLRKLMQASDSDSDSSTRRDRKRRKRKKEKKERKERKRSDGKKRRARHESRTDRRVDVTAAKAAHDDTSPRSTFALTPAMQAKACTASPHLTVTISGWEVAVAKHLSAEECRSPPSPSIVGATRNGEFLKPGLNISPRKLEKSPTSPLGLGGSTASLPRHRLGGGVIPVFRLDGSWP